MSLLTRILARFDEQEVLRKLEAKVALDQAWENKSKNEGPGEARGPAFNRQTTTS